MSSAHDTMRNVPRTRKSVPLLDLDDERMVKSQVLCEELLPGIPNEITLNHIVTKLPYWRDFHILPSVSRSWLQAIRSHQVYDARVGSHSTETLAVVNHEIDDDVSMISLYSVRDGRLCELPPIPHLGGIPSGSQCISLDGKLYVLGGLREPERELASDQVYVLDLAGQRRWRKCASMQQPRELFGCGILNGKIFVCGGVSLFEPVCGAEIYDPEVNAWSPLPPTRSMRFSHDVGNCGDFIVVHGGNVYHPDYLDWKDNRFVDNRRLVRSLDGAFQGALWDYYDEDDTSWEVYQPDKEEWQPYLSTTPNHLPFTETQLTMFTEGGIYSMSWGDIYINDDNGQDGWTHLHSLSSESSVGPRDADSVWPFVPVVIDDELLTIVHWETSSRVKKSCLVRSRGFCSEKKEIVWQDAHCSGSDKHARMFLNYIIGTVKL